jgi:hypothetical protein
MTKQPAESERYQLWSLMELAGSAEAVLDAECHLTRLFGRRPGLYELANEIMERNGAPIPAETLARRVSRSRDVFLAVGT